MKSLCFVVCSLLLLRPLISKYLLLMNKNSFLCIRATQLDLFYALWRARLQQTFLYLFTAETVTPIYNYFVLDCRNLPHNPVFPQASTGYFFFFNVNSIFYCNQGFQNIIILICNQYKNYWWNLFVRRFLYFWYVLSLQHILIQMLNCHGIYLPHKIQNWKHTFICISYSKHT